MTGRRLGCLVLLATGVYFMMLYDFQGLRFLFCCVICLPLASLLLLVPKAFLCRVDADVKESSVTRGETVYIRITMENKGLLPVPRLRMAIRWKASGEKEITVKRWLYGFGRGKEEIALEVSASHCGEAELTITKAGVCDYLGIFILPVRKTGTVKFCITPVITPIVQEEALMLSQCAQVFQGETEGDVILRGYQPGDSMQRVYWKLAAKAEELQVRELERSESITLFLNYSHTFREQTEKWDSYLDTACSVLCFLAEESKTLRRKPEVVWQQGGSCRKCEIDGMEALREWILGFLMQKETGAWMEDGFRPEEGLHLDEDCRLYLGEQCVYE